MARKPYIIAPTFGERLRNVDGNYYGRKPVPIEPPRPRPPRTMATPQGITVRITDRTTIDGVGYYDWIEVDKQPGFPATVEGRSGTYATYTAAIEINFSNAAIEVAEMRVVIFPLATPHDESDGGAGSDTSAESSDDGGAAWWFDVSVPPPPFAGSEGEIL